MGETLVEPAAENLKGKVSQLRFAVKFLHRFSTTSFTLGRIAWGWGNEREVENLLGFSGVSMLCPAAG